jgi:acetylornithine/N-succinyldiaminopimelate aminotransferase
MDPDRAESDGRTMTAPHQLGVVMPTAHRPDAVMVAGDGSWLIDSEGCRYLDFIQGWAVNCLGHCSPVVVDALNDQSKRLINASPAYYNEPMVKLAGRLGELSGLDEVFFCSTGAEANEGAIKLARKWGNRHRKGAYEIITMSGGFHGRTLATMSASGKAEWESLFEPKVPGFTKVPLNDITAVRGAVTDRTVAVMVEPTQGEAGVFEADDDYLVALRELTEELGLLLIFDEVQTGVGRTGTFLASEHSQVRADIVTMGKGLGGGTPLAALLARSAVSCFESGDQGGTFNGNALLTAVGLAVVETVSAPDFLARVRELGSYMRGALESLSKEASQGVVRGRGLLLAMETPGGTARDIAERAFAAGLLVNAPRDDTLRFMPALTVDEGEVDEMVVRLRLAIAAA